jgi:predicted nucleic acid-binding protein
MYVLDTNVVSELRRLRPHGAVLAWLASTRESEVFISAATVGEIQAGIEKTRENNVEKAIELERWLVEIVLSLNVIAPDAETFRIWARLMHRRQSQLWDDAMIAATAIQRNYTVVTRNLRDFRLFE